MLINIDISTATMYKSGKLIQLCLDYLRKEHPAQLFKQNLPERELLRLQRFISGIRILTPTAGVGGRIANTPRVVKRLTRVSAREEMFSLREGGQISVADYFRQTMNKPLQYPDLFCAEVCPSLLRSIDNRSKKHCRWDREQRFLSSFARSPLVR